tara:strand:- start:321 stop:965 length:645 start_codon:yes stop_codon:yes gene_type:complete
MDNKLNLEQYKGCFVRPDTCDKEVVAEMERSYGWLSVEGKRVLDVGANIGTFSRMALNKGASFVESYEPDLDNSTLAKLNAPEADIKTAALITGKEKEIALYINPTSKNHGNFSTTEYRGREAHMVPAVNFAEVLSEFKPDVIKMDCEGAEYDLLRNPLPEFVKEISLEIHLMKKNWRNYEALKLVENFSDWETVVQPKIGKQNWHTLAGYRRK